MKRLFMRETGSALPLTLVVIIIVMIFVVSLLNTVVADASHAARSESKTQAHYLARSGINVGFKMLEDSTPYDDSLQELIDELNVWAADISPVSLGLNESFELRYELVEPRDIKIIAKGMVDGYYTIEDTVTLRVKMLTSFLTGGKASGWYNNDNTSNLVHNMTTATSYIGQGVYLEGKSNSSTSLPSNSGGGSGSSIYQASIIQVLENGNNVSLSYPGNVQPSTFDCEIIIFNGRVVMSESSSFTLNLSLSEQMAKNKINNTPESVLYVTDSNVRNKIINDGNTGGVGFENEDYYKYFTGQTYENSPIYDEYAAQFNTSPEIYTRYGIVMFGEKLVRSNNENQSGSSTSILPIPANPSNYAPGYYFFPDGINLNSDNLGDLLVPIHKDDPIVEIIELISKISISNYPFIWDKK